MVNEREARGNPEVVLDCRALRALNKESTWKYDIAFFHTITLEVEQ